MARVLLRENAGKSSDGFGDLSWGGCSVREAQERGRGFVDEEMPSITDEHPGRVCGGADLTGVRAPGQSCPEVKTAVRDRLDADVVQ